MKWKCPKCGRNMWSDTCGSLGVARSNHLRYCGNRVSDKKILKEIRKHSRIRVVDLERMFGESSSRFSVALKRMVAAGVLKKERRGISVYYLVNNENKGFL